MWLGSTNGEASREGSPFTVMLGVERAWTLMLAPSEPFWCQDHRGSVPHVVCRLLALGGLFGTLASCSGRTEGAPPQRLVEPPPQELLEACSRFCGASEAVERVETCTLNQRMFHGVVFEQGEPLPDAPAPVSHDPECLDTCFYATVRDCWRQIAAYADCLANEIWVCEEGGWWPEACLEAGNDPAICEG